MSSRPRFLFAVLLVLCVLGAAAMAGDGPSRPRGFSAVPLHPDIVAQFRAHGLKPALPFPNSANQGRKFAPGGDVIPALTTATTQKVLVIFVSFANDPPGGPATRLDLAAYFDSMLFGASYNPPEYAPYRAWYLANKGFDPIPTDRTLHNFYEANSYGQVNVTTDNLPSALGWVQLPHTYEYYCAGQNGMGPAPNNAAVMVKDAVLALAAAGTVDFSHYAVEGEVPNLFVVHAGSGGEWNYDPNLIWSHSWSLTYGAGGAVYVNGIKIDTYATMPEVGGDTTHFWSSSPGGWGPFPPTFGVYAHEYGHVLGLPDQYDYGYESEGTGYLSLMAFGSWNGYPYDSIFSGNSPSNLDAWSKYRLGFIMPTEISGTAHFTLPPSENDPMVLKMVVPNSGGKEYFLFENRQLLGFDQGLGWAGGPHGLAIWHIDDVVLSRSYWRPNEAENWKLFRSLGWQKANNGETHYGISLMQADGLWELEKAAWYTNSPYVGDLYPGYWGVHSFDSFTNPNSSAYYFWGGSDPKFGYSGVTVQNILENTSLKTVDADFSFVPWVSPAKK